MGGWEVGEERDWVEYEEDRKGQFVPAMRVPRKDGSQMILAWLFAAAGLGAGGATPDQDLTGQVRAAEVSFAKTMADRDLEAFASFVSEEAIFFGSSGTLRGREAVVEGWRALFQEEAAPFSWEPETVEVLESGVLAYSSGPVRDPDGNVVAVFNSVWRLEADGMWRVVFDKGCAVGG